MAKSDRRGAIERMVRNPVAANLLMLLLILGGALMASRVKQEVFPEVTLDQVIVTVPFPGASPEEVEEGVIVAVEEAVRAIDGVKEVRATAAEGSGRVVVELRSGVDRNRALSDVKSEVDAIQSFPENAERPLVGLTTNRQEVLSVIISGDVPRPMLRHAAERVRTALLRDERITQVEVTGLPAPEISIEVPQDVQRRYGLTLPQIAERVGAASLDLPGGGVDTESGEVLVRTREEKDRAAAFSDVTLIARPDGSRVTLGEVAEVRDTLRDVDNEAYLDGEPAARVRVFRVGDQTPVEVSAAVHEYLEGGGETLSPDLALTVWNDQSKIYEDRVSLLLENAAIGVLLVILLLGVFLDLRLAFWVTLGIPISFLGAVLLMPALGVSINMISLFAFILALGIVVDDAIVVGESIFSARREGKSGLEAAVAGAKVVRAPIVFAVLTTITAFVPLLMVPGVTGEFFDNIPLVVIPILLLSLVESFFILPSHLAHLDPSPKERGVLGWLSRRQAGVSRALERFVERRFGPIAAAIVERRYLTLSAAAAVLMLTGGLIAGGYMRFTFFPEIEGDVISASARLPYGAPMERTRGLVEDMTAKMRALGASAADDDEDAEASNLVRSVYAEIGSAGPGSATDGGGQLAFGSHLASVQVQLVAPGQRATLASTLSEQWRKTVGEPAGVEQLDYAYGIGPPTGAAIAVDLSHPDRAALHRAASELASALKQYSGVTEVDDGVEQGKPQLDLKLRPEGRALGLSEADLAGQVRAAFFGAEARRQQRGRFELRIYVRRPASERKSVQDLEQLIVLTPRGGEIPLSEVARSRWTTSPTAIDRIDRRRVTTVTADVLPDGPTAGEVTQTLARDTMPGLVAHHPGLDWTTAGEQEEQAESLGSLRSNMLLALVAMFALMAIAFRSYVQPIALMVAIPFGVVGAIGGHLLMGYDLSIISILGIVALSGVVVNDSLVLVSAVNDLREEGMELQEALVEGAKRRFRPILLTSLTTFLGLAPMILETSMGAAPLRHRGFGHLTTCRRGWGMGFGGLASA